MGDGGFQMQAASDKDGDDFIVVRRKNGGKLADAFGVAALGETDKEPSADAKDIAAFESSWKREVFEFSKPGEGPSKRTAEQAAAAAALDAWNAPDTTLADGRAPAED